MNREIFASPGDAGLTVAVTKMQYHLHGSLPWLEKSFGLATDGYAVNAEKLTLTVPEIYIGNGEYDVVLPDDRYVSQVFYYADAAEQVVDGSPFLGYRMECNVSVVVWLDLDKIKAEMGYAHTHRFVDELKQEAVLALNSFGDFQVERIESNVQRVWQNWTIGRGVLYYGDKKEYALTQIGKHPEAGFRIYGKLYYEDSCEEYSLPSFGDAVTVNKRDGSIVSVPAGSTYTEEPVDPATVTNPNDSTVTELGEGENYSVPLVEHAPSTVNYNGTELGQLADGQTMNITSDFAYGDFEITT